MRMSSRFGAYLFRRAGIETANRVEAKLYDTFASLATTPGQGHQRADLTKDPVLFFTVYQYMIVYRARTPLEIVRVLHGKRNVRRILKESSPQ